MAFYAGAVIAEAILDSTKYLAGAKSITDSTEKMSQTLKNIGGKLSTFVTLPLLGIAAASLKSAADFEKQQVAFETMLKSADKAQALLQQIEDFSATTPFQMPGLIEGAKRLIAFGVGAEDVIDKMRNLGNAAQGDQGILDRLTLAFGKLRAKGKATLEELNMFTEAGVPILQALADQYGVTTAEMFKLISTGKVGFEDVDKALTNLTTGQGQFAGLIEKQSETLSGLFSTLADNLSILGRSVLSEVVPALKEIIGGAINLVKGFSNLDDGMKSAILRLGGLAIAAGPVISLIGNIQKALIGLSPKIAALFGPAGLVVAGVTALITLGTALDEATGKTEMMRKKVIEDTKARTGYNEIQKKYNATLDKFLTLTNEEINSLSEASEEQFLYNLKKQQAIINSLKFTNIMDLNNSRIAEEEQKLVDLTAAYDEFIVKQRERSLGTQTLIDDTDDLNNEIEEETEVLSEEEQKLKDLHDQFLKLALDDRLTTFFKVLTHDAKEFKEELVKVEEQETSLFDKMINDFDETFENMLQQNLLTPFEVLGESLATGEDALANLGTAFLGFINTLASKIAELLLVAGLTAILNPATAPLGIALIAAAGIVALGGGLLKGLAKVEGFAEGGMARGLALVGEEGPELVNVGSTSRIFPADETAGIRGVQVGSLITINGNVSKEVDIEKAMLKAGQDFQNLIRGVS